MTNGLDMMPCRKVRNLIHDYVKSGENSAIFTSHVVGEIERVSDSVILIDDGTTKFSCNKDDLLYNYSVFQITSKQLLEIDTKDILKIKRGEFVILINEETINIINCSRIILYASASFCRRNDTRSEIGKFGRNFSILVRS